MARYKRLQGFDVFFLTGVDEHGQKAEKAAIAQGIHPKELADGMVHKFTDLWEKLDISNTGFVRPQRRNTGRLSNTCSKQ